MPLVEAMACGKPVITTASGPARDFCSEETAYLIAAEVVPVPDDLPADQLWHLRTPCSSALTYF